VPSSPCVCVQWSRFGPYHHARIAAVRDRFAREGVRTVAVETAGRDALYTWEAEAHDGAEHVRLFADASVHDLPSPAIRRAMTEALDAADPVAVAISAYSAPDALAALAWCRRRRRTAVVMMESKRDDVPRKRVAEWLKGHVVRAYDSALAGGTPQEDYLRGLGFPQAYVFRPYDVVDNAFFAAGADAVRADLNRAHPLPGLATGGPFFLASNRFVERKNLPALIHAYDAYRRAAPESPWPLLLLGDGPQRPELEALVRGLRTEGVVFVGFRQLEDLPAYYALAGAFVHPALADQWGLVVNEAMAAGLPVVVSRASGCAHDLVIEGETGFTFDPADWQELAGLLGRIAALPEAERGAMGARARQRIQAWSPEAFADGLWAAVQAGAARADRPMPPVARAVLAGLRAFARRPDSFHRIRE